MPSAGRALELEDLDLESGRDDSPRFEPKRRATSSIRRSIGRREDQSYSPCQPRNLTLSTSGRLRRRCDSRSPSWKSRCAPCGVECQTVRGREMKSGCVVCDKFGTVCYPRNGCVTRPLSWRDTCTSYTSPSCRPCGPPCGPPSWRPCPPSSCSPCSPSLCSPCPPACPTPPRRCGPPVCRKPYRCSLPCPSDDDCCEPEASSEFKRAMQCIGPCTSRYQSHYCPWEADVTVNGTIRAHCTSTADEITNRLAGPFKAFGKRFTTDSECVWPSFNRCRKQSLSLGVLDDGGCLDFSGNNKPQIETPRLEDRVRRITESEHNVRKSETFCEKHTCFDRGDDRHIERDDSYDEGDRCGNKSPLRNIDDGRRCSEVRHSSNERIHHGRCRGHDEYESHHCRNKCGHHCTSPIRIRCEKPELSPNKSKREHERVSKNKVDYDEDVPHRTDHDRERSSSQNRSEYDRGRGASHRNDHDRQRNSSYMSDHDRECSLSQNKSECCRERVPQNRSDHDRRRCDCGRVHNSHMNEYDRERSRALSHSQNRSLYDHGYASPNRSTRERGRSPPVENRNVRKCTKNQARAHDDPREMSRCQTSHKDVCSDTEYVECTRRSKGERFETLETDNEDMCTSSESRSRSHPKYRNRSRNHSGHNRNGSKRDSSRERSNSKRCMPKHAWSDVEKIDKGEGTKTRNVTVQDIHLWPRYDPKDQFYYICDIPS